jgi:hypothetical protein
MPGGTESPPVIHTVKKMIEWFVKMKSILRGVNNSAFGSPQHPFSTNVI